MRSETEMYELILSFARADDRVRAVCLNGSRANPNAPRDIFQDFDIVYLVTELDSFKRDPNWVAIFGERVVMQLPDDSALFEEEREGRYAYLMQFLDGNRIDLTLILCDQALEYCREDGETIILLDKDQRLPVLAPATDAEYHVKRPTQAQFASCCNEFWWVSPYVAKGLWRGELLFAMYHMNNCVRDMLEKMLTWKVGIRTDFSVSTGKCGKYLQKYLPAEDWEALTRTFARCNEDDVWRAMTEMTNLFRKTALFVAKYFGYSYPRQDDERVMAYLKHVRRLPRDAQSFDD